MSLSGYFTGMFLGALIMGLIMFLCSCSPTNVQPVGSVGVNKLNKVYDPSTGVYCFFLADGRSGLSCVKVFDVVKP